VQVEQFFGDAADVGRPARLDGLELLSLPGTAADLLHNLAEGRAHGHLDQAGGDLAHQGEDLAPPLAAVPIRWNQSYAEAMTTGTLAKVSTRC
jgi:hypothetical protein